MPGAAGHRRRRKAIRKPPRTPRRRPSKTQRSRDRHDDERARDESARPQDDVHVRRRPPRLGQRPGNRVLRRALALARYDANGNENLVTDFNGNQTELSYNAKGQLTQKIEAYNTAVARTTTYVWDPTYNRRQRNRRRRSPDELRVRRRSAARERHAQEPRVERRAQPDARVDIHIHEVRERPAADDGRRRSAGRRRPDHLQLQHSRRSHQRQQHARPHDELQPVRRRRPTRARDRSERRCDRPRLLSGRAAQSGHDASEQRRRDDHLHLRGGAACDGQDARQRDEHVHL